MQDVDQRNVETYEHKYGQAGYGLQYPDGHVIRIHRQVLEYELGMAGGAMLDYGCGNGSHLEYFYRAGGYEPYGCDISASAIEQCRARLPEYADRFRVVEPVSRLSSWVPSDLDLVFSNQVLYYLDDAGIATMVDQFAGLLRPGGALVATMMAPTNYYHRRVVERRGDLEHVVLQGRLNEDTWINFKTQQETRGIFERAGFETVQLGSYGWVIREDEGRTDHWIYVGRKP